jgi:hypothetical protein
MKRSYGICAAAILSTAGTAWGDVTVKATYKTGGETTNYVAYLTKTRQRFEYGGSMKLIRRLDRHAVIEIDDETRSWVAIPLEPQASGGTKGGVVTVATTVVDTGETRTLFGLTARHLKTTVVTSAGPGACHPGQETVETDGWYVDIEYPDPAAADPASAGCRDEIRYQNNGAARPGYPVAFTSRTMRDKTETTLSGEVTEFSTAAIPESTFEPPSGYTERKSVEAIAAARPKPAGVVRVGVIAVTDSTGQQLAVRPLNARLASMLAGQGVQGVPLASAAEAGEAHCDFILNTEVAGVTKSAVGQVAGKVLKLGGMLSRGGGKAPAQDGTEATLRFTVTRLGQDGPVLSSSATGKNGSALNLKTALQLASLATPMGLMVHSMGGGSFGMFAAQWGMRGPGFGAPDPGLAMMFRGLEQTAAPAAAPASPEMAAVCAALENEAHAVTAAVKGGA